MLQLPLNIQLDDNANFDNFFIGDNRQLVARVANIHQQKGSFVYLWGKAESGKSHLAQALCHRFAHHGMAGAYIPLKEPELMPEILEGMSTLDLVCLDDVENVAGDADWESAIFNLYNTLKLDEKSLLVLGGNSPLAKDFQLPDLNSRLAAMEVYRLESLADQQKVELLVYRAANRGIPISDEVAKFMITRLSRSVSDLVEILDKLDHSSIALQRKVTIPLIKDLFKL